MRSRYLSSTWLLAHAIHPFVFHVAAVHSGSNLDLWAHLAWAGLSFVFTVAAVLFCFGLLHLVLMVYEKPEALLVLWAGVVVLSIPLTIFLLAAALDGKSFFLDLFDLLWPGMAAAFLATIVRYKQFFQLVNPQQHFASSTA